MSNDEKKEKQEIVAKPEEVKLEAPVEKVESSANEAPQPTAKSDKPAPSGKFKDLTKQIEELSVADLADLVKELEDRFGVSAAAPVAAAGAAPAAAGGAGEEEEKSNYTVILASSGEQKIAVIKALREINQNLGLKEAKDLADTAPKEILKDAPKVEAEEAKKKLEAAGAKVELK